MYTLLTLALAASIIVNVYLARRAKGLKAARELSQEMLEMMSIAISDVSGTVHIEAIWEGRGGEKDSLLGLLQPEKVDGWVQYVTYYVEQTGGKNLQIKKSRPVN